MKREEYLGRKEIVRGVREKGWCVNGAHKSDTQDNFLESMKEHYRNEAKVNYEQVLDAKAWRQILGVGNLAGEGQSQRCDEALNVMFNGIPSLLGLRKDHKVYEDVIRGPPLRPLCNGNLGPNAPLANLLAKFLRCVRSGIYENNPSEVLSTEEVLHLVQNFNQEVAQIPRRQPGRAGKCPPIQTDEIVVGSMDIKALYPNCKILETAKVIEQAVRSCDLEFKGIDRKFLCQFVSVLMKGEIPDKRLQRYLQVPKSRTTINSFISKQSDHQVHGPQRNQLGTFSQKM